MRGRQFRTLALLYPKAWRERYSEEVTDLSGELLATGETTRLRLALGLARSALIERVRSSHKGGAMAVLSGTVALVLALALALVIGGVFQGQPRLSPSPSATVVSVKQVKPVLLPMPTLGAVKQVKVTSVKQVKAVFLPMPTLGAVKQVKVTGMKQVIPVLLPLPVFVRR